MLRRSQAGGKRDGEWVVAGAWTAALEAGSLTCPSAFTSIMGAPGEV